MLLDLLHISVENKLHHYKYEIISTRQKKNQKKNKIIPFAPPDASLSTLPVVFTEEQQSMVNRTNTCLFEARPVCLPQL